MTVPASAVGVKRPRASPPPDDVRRSLLEGSPDTQKLVDTEVRRVGEEPHKAVIALLEQIRSGHVTSMLYGGVP